MFDKAAFILAMFFVAILLAMPRQYSWFDAHDEVSADTADLSRRSITFLLGADKEDQQYFSLAESHFLFDEVERTDNVVKSCRSLTAVLDYLERESGGAPWGCINVVVHGNMWSGLSVPMWQDGERAYPKELFGAAMNGSFPVLDSLTIDGLTAVNVWACGIGNNPLIRMALESIFTNADGVTANVHASPHFVIFHRVPGRLAPVRLKASYWPYFFKRGYRPGAHEIATALSQQFPDDTISWKDALQREQVGPGYEVFKEEFSLPIVWTVFYAHKSDRPSVNTVEERMSWVKAQPELMEKVDAFEIPIDNYNWTVNKIIHTLPDGSMQPAIKAIGMCTVLCVVAPEADKKIENEKYSYSD